MMIKNLQAVGKGIKNRKPPKTAIELAARATELFFYRLIRRKSDIAQSVDSADGLSELLDLLLSFKSIPEMLPFSAFFNEAENFLSPLYDLSHFRAIVLKTIAPSVQLLFESVFINSSFLLDDEAPSYQFF